MSLSSAVFAFAVAIVLLYLIPQAVHRRAVLAESTADDRFSPRMRMLPVDADAPVTLARSVRGPVLDPVSAKKRLEARDMLRPTAPVAARMTARDISAARAKHAARIAERAAAVRRRQILAATLLGLSVLLWVVGFATSISWAWALIPTALLAAVLEAGRRVAASYRRADLASRKSIAMLERRLRQMQLRDNVAEPIPNTSPADDVEVPTAPKHAAAPEIEQESVPEPEIDETSAPMVVAEEVPEAVVADVSWDPVVLPAPSYTLKATAPRAAITPDEDILPSGEKLTRTPMRPTRPSMLNAGEAEAEVAPPAPAIDIDSALARRRVAGE
ncbi:hypothetical protein BSZ39_02465 [Bowdeniella nasicola]|uniref:Uncharacterized protein n=1 Tax=Bowdeniella nasicola TaxID=208480 RepID=A0A1Q5Q4N3_9ACTO|nr:hypothetical protein [Bowdeniella nasicola]OKL54766.1 hypothetical protein BSZ39_02465 [Bowdeniella nasicola]